MTTSPLATLASARLLGRPQGITSICSAHPLVIEAALCEALDRDGTVLIEATCNQVNHRGGYTGMTPAAFRDFVEAIARKVGLDRRRIILGGDHLGPNPWKSLDASKAMAEAAEMVAAYVGAGFGKIHLDTSMGCRNEPVALADAQTAERAARLAEVAERTAAASGLEPPVYVLGTEVPVPGGALEELADLQVTQASAALRTVEIHRDAFYSRGLDAAFERAVAVVVQPGVEFGNAEVVVYRPENARDLAAVLDRIGPLVFEAHSTDYQPAEALRQLVADGFAILKVGPGLSFALRQALYGLDHIAEIVAPNSGPGLRAVMEELMLAEPEAWASHYHGSNQALYLQRHFSYSDRIRYYWAKPAACAAIEALFARLDGQRIPETLIAQYLEPLYADVASGRLPARPRALCIAAVRHALRPYSIATRPLTP